MLAAMRARRSCLSVPASSAKMLEKARSLPADELVLDLEDAVAPGEKDAARETLVTALAKGFGERTVSVRINGVGSPWLERDVADVVGARAGGARVDCLTVPKVESAADLLLVAGLAERAESGGEAVGLEALIETAAGLARAVEIATSTSRLEALILGYADLGASLGLPAKDPDPSADRWHFARGALIVAARTGGVAAIDGPFLALGDVAGLAREAGRASALGFDGKWAIHPAQLEALNERFTPAADEVERARAVIGALVGAAGGVARLGGEMIDEASRKQAERVLARAGAARV